MAGPGADMSQGADMGQEQGGQQNDQVAQALQQAADAIKAAQDAYSGEENSEPVEEEAGAPPAGASGNIALQKFMSGK